MLVVRCNYCGKKLKRYKSGIKKSNFCNNYCLTSSQRKRIKVKCCYCKKVKEITPCQKHNSKHYFCCEKHYSLYQKGSLRSKRGKVVKCCVCHKKLYRHPCELKAYNNHVCSPICFGIYMSKTFSGSNSWSWLGGKSFEIYSISFSNKLRKEVRKRYNYTCPLCKRTEKQLGYELSIHHIDYNKQNNSDWNLISLCRSCHAKTNHSRIYWIILFMIDGVSIVKGGGEINNG